MSEEGYANIREILGDFIGQRVLTISQHDRDDFLAGEDAFVELMFENGMTLKFFTLDSSLYKAPGAFCFSDPNGDSDEYVPSEEEKEQRGWIVVDRADMEGGHKHILPNFCRNHLLNMDCWCHPKYDDFAEDIINHREEKP